MNTPTFTPEEILTLYAALLGLIKSQERTAKKFQDEHREELVKVIKKEIDKNYQLKAKMQL